ncbi:MAG TPA: VWA domain-containing protein [Spirochaetia bacterium]|nr:VWA domain-containing protein [Spirochaetia bacterium]
MQHPAYLFLLFLLVPVILVCVRQYRKAGGNLKRIGSRLRENSFYEVFVVKWFFGSLLTILTIIMCVLALAGFKGKGKTETVSTRGTDVFIVLDISRSMLCEDLSPSRLSLSVSTIQSLIESPGVDARYGLIIFSGKAVKIVPLTEDRVAVSGVLRNIRTSLVTAPGTNSEEAIDKAVRSFSKTEEREKVIILFSDGEFLSGDLDRALTHARAEDVRILAVGTGTKAGGLIPLGGSSFVVNRAGERVISQLNPGLLKRIADATSGEYLDAADPALIRKLSDSITHPKGGGSRYRYRIVVSEVYRPFLSAAVFSLFFSVIVRFLRWKNTF